MTANFDNKLMYHCTAKLVLTEKRRVGEGRQLSVIVDTCTITPA